MLTRLCHISVYDISIRLLPTPTLTESGQQVRASVLIELDGALYLAPIFGFTKRNRLAPFLSSLWLTAATERRASCLNYSNLRQANESAAQTASRRPTPDVKAKLPSPCHLLLRTEPETKTLLRYWIFRIDSLTRQI